MQQIVGLAACLVCLAIVVLPAPVPAQNFRKGLPITLTLIPEAERPQPQAFTLADVNNASGPDLVVISENAEGDTAIAVLLNNGDGTFGSPTFFVDVDFDLDDATAVAVADVGAPGAMPPDGNMDIVAIDALSSVVPLWGNGVGGFQFAGEGERFDAEEASGDLVGIAIDNFDNLNGPDLALIDDDGQLLFFCGTELGTFDACLTNLLDAAGDVPVSLGTGDMDGDGDRDVVVLSQDTDAGRAGRIALFRNAGDGSFALAPPALEAGSTEFPPLDVTVARLDGDDIDDAALVFAEPLGGDSVQIFLGQSNGRLSARNPQPPGLSFSPSAIESADFDSDQINDLIMAESGEDIDGAFVTLGDGTGDFGQGVTSNGLLTGGSFAVATGDLDGDTRTDFVVGLEDRSGLRVGLNIGIETPPPTETPTPPAGTVTVTPTPSATRVPTVALGTCNVPVGEGQTEPFPLASGDLDRDGDRDLVTVDRRTGTLYVLLVSPAGLDSDSCSLQGTRILALPTPTGTSPAVAVGDLNRDDRLDIAVALAGGVTILLASGADGEFTVQPTVPVGTDPRSIAIVHRNINGIADLNNDNIADLVTANHGSNSVSLLYGVGDGTFGTATNVAVTSPPNVVLPIELTNDATMDLAVATDSGVTMIVQAPLGTFTGTALNVGGAATALAPFDFVQGGAQELLVVVRGSDNRGSFLIIQRNTMNNFVVGTAMPTGPRPTSVGMGRFGGVGGAVNVVIASDGDRTVIFQPFENGTFGAALEGVAVGSAPSALVVDDFDGDGQMDVVVANSGDGTLTFLRSSRPPPTQTPTITSTATPTPTETPIRSPSETPPPSVTRSFTRAPSRTPKPGTLALSEGCAIASLGANSGDAAGLLVPVALLLIRRRRLRGARARQG